MSLTEPLFAFMPTKDKTWFQRYGPYFYCHPFWAVLHQVPFAKKWVSILKGEIPLRLQDLIVPSEFLLFVLFAPSVSVGIFF